MSVKKIIVHDEYDYDELATPDIAIIQLTEKIAFSSVANGKKKHLF